MFSLFFLVFKHDFIRCVDLTCISASNTENDGITNEVTHKIFNRDLYSCAHFVVEIHENLALMAVFNTLL